MKRIALTALLLLAGLSAARAQTDESPDPYANETKEQKDARMNWWREARFGMFIHWGVYAVPAGTYDGKRIPGIGEWIMNWGQIPCATYQAYAKDFNPVKYDADAWVRLAKKAGMKYIVITAKHHDGFALFDSAVTEWDVAGATPYKKDLLAPLAEACRKHGLKLGFYYSQAQDWNHKGGAGNNWDPTHAGSMDDYINNIAVPQVKEILTKYGDGIPAVLWWDTAINMNPERAKSLIALLKNKPGIIHNNRLGGGFKGDTETPEQNIPATGYKDRDWETCMTLNDTWGFKSYDNNWKSTATLVLNLIDIASKGGNYLLNVGPTAGGEIPQPSIERLEEVGKWMEQYGSAIYGSSASPFAKLAWGRCTQKPGTLYLHVFDWPKDGRLVVPCLRNPVTSVKLLGGAALQAAATEEGVAITGLPATAPNALASVVELKYEGALKLLLQPGPDGVLTLDPAAADTTGSIQAEEKGGRSNLGFWMDASSTASWTFNLKQPGSYRITTEVAGTGPSAFTVACGAARLDAAVTAGAGYESFSKVELGSLALNAGEQKLVITPTAGRWNPINLRALTLTPAP